MALQDTQSRKKSPVKLVPLGYNSTASSDRFIAAGTSYGDLSGLIANGGAAFPPPTFVPVPIVEAQVQQQNLVRIPKPYSGEITELYLSFRLRLGDDEPGTRTMWVGFCNADKSNPSDPLPMGDASIKNAHESIFGDATGIQAGPGEYIQFHRVNIAHLLKRQQSGLGWFGLAFLFDQTPQREYDPGMGYQAVNNGYLMEIFRLEGITQFKGSQ